MELVCRRAVAREFANRTAFLVHDSNRAAAPIIDSTGQLVRINCRLAILSLGRIEQVGYDRLLIPSRIFQFPPSDNPSP